jgi:uncharacterized protein (DUF1697 family)
MRWVGFVRNVMLGREGLHRETLLGILESAGGADVRNHFTTGNVTFAAPPRRAGAIGRRAEAGIAAVIGRHEPVILRRVDWLQDLVEHDPFQPYRDGEWELEVGLLPLEVAPLDPALLPDPAPTIVVRVGEREVFTARPRDGRHRRHVVPMLQSATGSKVTSRGWSTLEKVAARGG